MNASNFRKLSQSKSINSSCVRGEDSFMFSQLEQASDYLQSSADKLRSYHIAHNQDNVSLAYSESVAGGAIEEPLQPQVKSGKKKVKLEVKTPVMKSPKSKGQFKDRVERLGLENLMKQLVLGQESTPQSSDKLILAFNRTYITRKMDYKHQGMVATIARKSSKSIQKKSAPAVDWNPQSKDKQFQFSEISSFIPNYMFPCRKNQTRLLKSRQKSKNDYQATQPYKFTPIISPSKNKSQASSTTSVIKRPMSGNLERPGIVPLRKSMEKQQRRVWSAQTNSGREVRSELRKSYDGEDSDLLKGQKARIYQ